MNGSGWVKLDVIGIEAWLSKASKGSQSALWKPLQGFTGLRKN